MRARGQVAATGTPVQSGVTIDISVDGISMMLAAQVADGAACHIRFEIPDGGATKVIQASAKVTYCVCVGQQGFRVGFNFSAIDHSRSQLINAL